MLGAKCSRCHGFVEVGSIDIVNGFQALPRQLAGRAFEDNATGAHADDTVAVGACGVERVQVDEDGNPVFLVDAAQRLHDTCGICRIERCNRLVREHDLRTLDEGLGDGDALLLSTRKSSGLLHGLRQKIQAMERLNGHCRFLVAEAPRDGREQALVGDPAEEHIGQYVHALDQIELLEDHRAGCTPEAQLPSLQPGHVLAAKHDPSVGRLDQPVDKPQQGRFSSTAPADDTHHLTFVDSNCNVIDSIDRAEGFLQRVERQHSFTQSTLLHQVSKTLGAF